MSKLEEMDELSKKAEGQSKAGPRPPRSICERILTVPNSALSNFNLIKMRLIDKGIEGQPSIPLL